MTSFEEETGCQVNVTTAGTSDEMVALMQEGGGQYDLVTASGDASLRLIAPGTVQPVNLDLIESYSTVDPNLQDAEWFTVDTDGDGTTEHYGTPYQWGSNVLMYSTAAFKGKAPDSWSVVFRADPPRRRVEQGSRAGLRRRDLRRRCRAVPARSRPRHRGSVRAHTEAVRRGAGSAAPAA